MGIWTWWICSHDMNISSVWLSLPFIWGNGMCTLPNSRWLVWKIFSHGNLSQTLTYFQELLKHPQFHGLSLAYFHQADLIDTGLQMGDRQQGVVPYTKCTILRPEERRKRENERVIVRTLWHASLRC